VRDGRKKRRGVVFYTLPLVLDSLEPFIKEGGGGRKEREHLMPVSAERKKGKEKDSAFRSPCWMTKMS